MQKTRKLTERFTACDLCEREQPKGGLITVYEEGKWFCNNTCYSYYRFPTVEQYLADRHAPEVEIVKDDRPGMYDGAHLSMKTSQGTW